MPEPSDIFEIADQHRRALLEHERKAASEMVHAYGEAWKRIKAQSDDLLRKIAEARAAGQDVNQSWLFQAERLRILQQQTEAEIRQFAQYAEQLIIAQQAEAVRAAQEHVEQLMTAGLGELPPGMLVTFARLPTQTLTDLVGFLQDGSPLRDLLDELGPEASESVRRALIAGVATGQNPRVIARQIRQALGNNLTRALRISRTEVLRSYREASKRTYQANDDVVKGWIWRSALGTRTCAACWAMHGTVHKLDERLDDHVNGRCAMVPVTKTWKELGFKDVPETQVQVEQGAGLFEQLSDQEKEKILGKNAFQAYEDLKIDLIDFVGRSRSSQWGTMRHARSLKDTLADSGMPKVLPGSAPGEPSGLPNATADLRRAIRRWREVAGGDLRNFELASLANEGTGFVDLGLPKRVQVMNNVDWDSRPGYQAFLNDRLARGVLTQTEATMIAQALPSTKAERLAETMLHEYGHVLTIDKIGIYTQTGWSKLPASLRSEVVNALVQSGISVTDYNIGEVIAEDARRYLSGKYSRLGNLTYFHDVSDLDSSFRRAKDVWEWLNAL